MVFRLVPCALIWAGKIYISNLPYALVLKSINIGQQGVGEILYPDVLGPTFVFRGKKWFTAQLGIGFAVDKGMA